MLDWVIYLAVYGLFGLLFGEMYMVGIRQQKREPTTMQYAMSVIIWPVFVVTVAIHLIKKD